MLDNWADDSDSFRGRQGEKTIGEQRLAQARGSQMGSSVTGGYSGGYSNGGLGNLAEQAKVGLNGVVPVMGQAVEGAGAGLSKVGAGLSQAGGGLAHVTEGLGGLAHATISATKAGAGALATGASVLADGVTAVASRLPTGTHEQHAQTALTLTSACFELAVSSSEAYETEDLGRVLDAFAEARCMPDLGQALLDLWYFMRTDALDQWGVVPQKRWLRALCAVKNSGRRDSGAAAVNAPRTVVEALREFSKNVSCAMGRMDQQQRDGWLNSIRTLTEGFEDSLPPPFWTFPKMGIVKYANCDETTFGVCIRGTEKAANGILVQGMECVAALNSGQAQLLPSKMAPVVMRDNDPGDEAGGVYLVSKSQKQQRQGLETTAGGSEKFEALCNDEAEKFFVQRALPITLHNRSSDDLKACFYCENDRLCVIPLGGVNGFGVVSLTPGRRVTVRPPSGDAFKVKVFEPRVIDKLLYQMIVKRGNAVELRSRDCTVN